MLSVALLDILENYGQNALNSLTDEIDVTFPPFADKWCCSYLGNLEVSFILSWLCQAILAFHKKKKKLICLEQFYSTNNYMV